MHIINPNTIVQLAEKDPEILNMRRQYHLALLNIQHLTLQPEHVVAAHDLVKEHAGLDIPTTVLESILNLYPETKVRIADNKGVIDTDINDLLLDVIAHFFLGCSWPIGIDNVDIDVFLSVLKRQAATFQIF